MNKQYPKYHPISCSFHDILLAKATLKETVKIVFINERGEEDLLQDLIVDVYTKDKAEYLQTANGTVIRLDFLKSVAEAYLADFEQCIIV